jgi:hypothetical protein
VHPLEAKLVNERILDEPQILQMFLDDIKEKRTGSPQLDLAWQQLKKETYEMVVQKSTNTLNFVL